MTSLDSRLINLASPMAQSRVNSIRSFDALMKTLKLDYDILMNAGMAMPRVYALSDGEQFSYVGSTAARWPMRVGRHAAENIHRFDTAFYVELESDFTMRWLERALIHQLRPIGNMVANPDASERLRQARLKMHTKEILAGIDQRANAQKGDHDFDSI